MDKHIISEIYDFRDKIGATQFHIDNMLNKTITMFKYRGLPKSLPERELELILQIKGYGIVTEHEGELVALWGGFAPPYNVYYHATKCIVTNPWANIDKTYTFGEDCVLIRNDPMNRGLMPILRKYGSMLTESDITQLLALINMRAIFAITADDDSAYESAQKFLQDIEDGKQGTMMSDSIKSGISTQPYGNSTNGYLTQIIEMQQYIKGSFFQEIGLQSTFNMKRERLSEAESGMDTDCLRPLIDSMLEERQKAVEEINEKYGTEITVEFNSSWDKYNSVPVMNTHEDEIEEAPVEEPVEETPVETPVEEPQTTEEPETVEEVIEEISETVEVIEDTVEEVLDEVKGEDDEDADKESISESND